MGNWMRGLTLAMMCGWLIAFTVGCEEEDDGTTPTAEATLPPLKLTDATPDLLITWVDERGGTHQGATVSEVPDSARDRVRIITKTAGHGSLFYVANLNKKNEDGSYHVETMRSGTWEDMLSARRLAYRNAHAPPAAPKATASASGPATPAHSVSAIVYGASWCGPCHQATRYLKKRGAAVVEYDIEKEPARAKEMRRKMKAAGLRGGSIPVIDVGGVMLQGFSSRAIDRALTKASKKPTSL